jgi:large subunit ribosomal protein L10
MPAQTKIDAVAKLREKFEHSEALILADPRGITVEEITVLRTQCREAGVELRVVKNRLAKIALGQASRPALDDLLIGPTMIAMGTADPATTAKMLTEYAKKNEKLKIKGGLLGKEPLTARGVQQLAALPSREELLTRLASCLAAPMTQFAGALGQIVGGFARALNAVAEQKQRAAA